MVHQVSANLIALVSDRLSRVAERRIQKNLGRLDSVRRKPIDLYRARFTGRLWTARVFVLTPGMTGLSGELLGGTAVSGGGLVAFVFAGTAGPGV